MITVISSSRYTFDRKKIRDIAAVTLQKAELGDNTNLNIVFVGKNKMRSLAKTYKNEDVALPVLTFYYGHKNDLPEPLFGEIIICYPQAILLAAERSKTVHYIMQFLIEHAVSNLLEEYKVKS